MAQEPGRPVGSRASTRVSFRAALCAVSLIAGAGVAIPPAAAAPIDNSRQDAPPGPLLRNEGLETSVPSSLFGDEQPSAAAPTDLLLDLLPLGVAADSRLINGRHTATNGRLIAADGHPIATNGRPIAHETIHGNHMERRPHKADGVLIGAENDGRIVKPSPAASPHRRARLKKTPPPSLPLNEARAPVNRPAASNADHRPDGMRQVQPDTAAPSPGVGDGSLDGIDSRNLTGVMPTAPPFVMPAPILTLFPKAYHATLPPLSRCENSLAVNMADALRMSTFERQQMIDLLKSIFGTKVMEAMEEPLPEQKFPSSDFLAFSGGSNPLDRSINTFVDRVTSLLNDPEIRDRFGNFILDTVLRTEVESRLRKLTSNMPNTEDIDVDGINEDKGDGQSEQTDAQAAERLGLAHLLEALDTAATADGCELLNGEERRNGVARAVDLAEIPDSVNGFIASRLTGRVMESILGNLILEADIRVFPNTTSNIGISMKSPMRNPGQYLCEGADVSNIYDFDTEWGACGAMTLLTHALVCPPDVQPDCAIAEKLGHTTLIPNKDCELLMNPSSGINWKQPMDITLQPSSSLTYDAQGNISQQSADKDGAVLYLLLRASQIQHTYSQLLGPCGVKAKDEILAGWRTVRDFWINPDGAAYSEFGNGTAKAEGYPMAVILQKGGQRTRPPPTKAGWPAFAATAESSDAPSDEGGDCDFLIVQRGTVTAYEWSSNLKFVMAPTEMGHGYDVHSGNYRLGLPVFTAMRDYFDTAFSTNQCHPKRTTITMTGHSLGGGLATMYAYLFAEAYAGLGVSLQAVAYAPMRSLSPEAMEFTTANVNYRAVVNELDSVVNVPCANRFGVPLCSGVDTMGCEGNGTVRSFAVHNNQVWIGKEDLPATLASDEFISVNVDFQISPVALLGVTANIKAPDNLSLGKQHIRAYQCAMGAYCSATPSLAC